MYKLLLCWRYLKTRYLALACIISVMLGVATLIVVNSVMSGFSTKLRDRLHGLLSDIVMEAHGMEGFADPQGKMARIREHPFLGPRIEAMACHAGDVRHAAVSATPTASRSRGRCASSASIPRRDRSWAASTSTW